MKKNVLLTFIFASMAVFAMKAESFPVVLKVIDLSKGVVTNKVDDNNEENIITWIDDELRPLNPSKTETEWWWPMYNDAEFENYTNGALIKTDEAWEWTLPIQAEPGTYEWNPHAKTLGWSPIWDGMYYYEGDNDENNLEFTVHEDGTVTGNYELVIPAGTYSGSMILAVYVPADTKEVFVRGLYGDWGTPIAMTYNDVEMAWVYEIDGSRIVIGEVQSYKYYYGADSYEQIEANADGSMRGDGDDRELEYEEDGVQWDTVLAWYVGGSSVNTIHEDAAYSISMDNRILQITGNVDHVTVYTLTGTVVDAANVNGTYTNTGLDAGLYIVKVNGISEKVIVK